MAVPVLGVVFALDLVAANAVPQRISFQILTGSTGGTYFPVGQLIAGLVSHPPGVDRCESSDVCGPSGLIASARTSEGAVANVLAVNAGTAESGLAQGDVVAQAVAGSGVFRKAGGQNNLRVMAALFPEQIHLLVARNSKIASVSDLRGMRVSLGAESSGTAVAVSEILKAYRLPVWRMKTSRNPTDVDAQLLRQGKIDAFFFAGGTPIALVDDLVSRGIARIVPIDGAGRDRLIKAVPEFSASQIPRGIYRGVGPVDTVSVRALWVVNARVPDTLVYGIMKALFSSGNRAALRQGHAAAAAIRLQSAVLDLPAPLHPGAARFYRDVGVLKPRRN
ncbi:MAG: TAXI family TRAP transporter solute-binding subunit [Proteobacteria bacterium]|nr:TAXI family TRAP transporter solute-binding subunit [Pseudomonadota bacterium]